MLTACAGGDDRGTRAGGLEIGRTVVRPREIPLELAVSSDRAEFSGMDWWGDRLVLLPQYPEVFAFEGAAGALPYITRDRLAAWIDGTDTTAIRPEFMAFDDHELPSRIAGWDGYEAISFAGDRACLAIECSTRGGWEAVLVRARVDPGTDAWNVALEPRLGVPGASHRMNFTEETLLRHDGMLWSLHELNGVNVNREPVARGYDDDLRPTGSRPMVPLEYRVTDATQCDADGRFWVFNQFWPGEAAIVDAHTDDLAAFDRPPGRPVERIVPLRFHDGAVEFDPTRPVIELALRADDVARNWEGLARWDGDGFLVVTDRHPRTVFAYVPGP